MFALGELTVGPFAGSRKLACTKEPHGCARCVREGVYCIYSPQKQMGRPRKQRAHDTPEPSHNQLPLNTNLAFLDGQDANMDFYDLLSPSFALPTLDDAQLAAQEACYPPGHFPFGANILGRIDFADCDDSDFSSNDLDDSVPHYMASQPNSGFSSYCPSPEFTPESSPSPQPFPNSQCRCLSTLYLAMDSLAHLPPSALAAMRVARNACRTAHDVLQCPSCSLPLIEDPLMKPPVQSYQNMMLLGGLVPTIANAYAQILGFVDAEAAQALAEGRLLHLGEEDYTSRDLEPEQWRLTVRSQLRIDAYGMPFPNLSGGMQLNQHHVGLKDVIDAMETRAHMRHAKVDALVATGQLHPEMHAHLMPTSNSPERLMKPNCYHIIEMAKGALEKLVIS